MKKLIPLLIMIFSLAFTQEVLAQVKTISGTVTAQSDGMPLPGVNVVIKGTAKELKQIMTEITQLRFLLVMC
jgi:hypothetical protein